MAYGGPPCQSHSVLGNNTAWDHDAQCGVMHWLGIITELEHVRFILIENVRFVRLPARPPPPAPMGRRLTWTEPAAG